MGIRKRKLPCKKCDACLAAPRDEKTGKRKYNFEACADPGEAWIVDYATTDRYATIEGDKKPGRLMRHIKTFHRRKDAETWLAETFVSVKKGTHTPASKSVTVQRAGENWIDGCGYLERSTVDQYQQHLKFHINPFLGAIKLSELTVPVISDWQSKLHKADRSAAMVRKVTTSLSTLLTHAMERGHVAQNVVRSMSANRRKRKVERRQKQRLLVGRDIPTPLEIDAILQHETSDQWRAFFLVAIRCGLRSSELRGLRWSDIDFKKSELHVRQRADRFNEIGNPKSEDSQRVVPIPPATLAALQKWKPQCPKLEGRQHFVFPNGAGHVESHWNIVERAFKPAWARAGITVPVLDEDGQATHEVEPKYTGLHSLRHHFASWCINRKVDGGLELPLKIVSERLGHSNIAITSDTYGHLFPRADDAAELAAAEGKFG